MTAVVTMPLTQNSSIPMMEVNNTSVSRKLLRKLDFVWCVLTVVKLLILLCLQVVSYPDDSMQDPAKPKYSAMLWKNDKDWTNGENVITIHTYPNVSSEGAKYISEDSKTSLEDTNVNEDNCMYKEERDANFNMESSNSSESSQSLKDVPMKQEELPTNLVSSTTVANPVNSTTVTQSIRTTSKKSKSGKESNR